ncbi:MAG: PTS sugar transporter subunit IIC [Erysipelotrichaceae bacterium]|jgi:mannose/fructose/N-acetylgalactosamine-specific phosphotransferase system component IIC|nr:PTS sugar transporter subunit IIC [Erysipelotrichaceae bacterium]
MQITVVQALLLGLFAFLIGTSMFPLGWLSQNIMNKPLVACMFIGLIMGQPSKALLVGTIIQAAYIGQMAIGGVSTLPRIDTALWFALPIALTSNSSADYETLAAETLTIALAFVPVNDILGTIGNMVKVAVLHKQDDIIEKGVIGEKWWFPVVGHVWTFVQNFVIVVIFCLAGSAVVTNIVAAIPPQVNKIMSTFTSLLPAIGFMILMVTLIHEPLQWIYFLFGFVLVAGLNWSTIAVTLIGCVIGYLVFQFTPSATVALQEDDD